MICRCVRHRFPRAKLKANAITIGHLRFSERRDERRHRSPIRGLDQPIPTLKQADAVFGPN
jgi:hypothetical protein